MKFICTARWDDGNRNFIEGPVDLSEEDVQRIAGIGAKGSDIGAMKRFEPEDEAAKAAIAKLRDKKKGPIKEGQPEDPELTSLRAEAKELKIPGSHLMGKDKLVEAIAKAKAE